MKNFYKKTAAIISVIAIIQTVTAQNCTTSAELDAVPGKFLSSAQYFSATARAEYFNKITSATDKATAKQTLEQIEKMEQQSHSDFKLTGGNWENYFSTEGYGYLNNAKLGQYTFQSAFHEFFCTKGKQTRSEEYSTVLRMYVNKIPLNTLDRFLRNPFGNSMGEYDYGFQFLDYKNHKSVNTNDQLISLFTYLGSNNESLINSINTGKQYFQDVPEKDIKPNNRSNYIIRYWFVKKNDIPVLVPVSRKEHLQSLLEYYEREKLHFTKLVAQLTADKSSSVKYYSNWQNDVADKIAIVKKTLNDNNENWLAKQAVINKMEDSSQRYKANLTEQTNYNRFWRFYDNENKSESLYKYNPDYFKPDTKNTAKPQIISVAFRYVALPSSLRILNNFTENFDFEALNKLLQ